MVWSSGVQTPLAMEVLLKRDLLLLLLLWRMGGACKIIEVVMYAGLFYNKLIQNVIFDELHDKFVTSLTIIVHTLHI